MIVTSNVGDTSATSSAINCGRFCLLLLNIVVDQEDARVISRYNNCGQCCLLLIVAVDQTSLYIVISGIGKAILVDEVNITCCCGTIVGFCRFKLLIFLAKKQEILNTFLINI